jgi:hypothetical protein
MIIVRQSDNTTPGCNEKHMSRPSHVTSVVALLSMVCLLALLPTAAQAQTATCTYYWIDTTNTTLAEVVVDDTIGATAPDSGDWGPITLAGIHALGLYSPSEDEAVAQLQGHYWEGAELGNSTRQTAWFVTTQEGVKRSIRAGSGSLRIPTKCWPGYVYSRAWLKKDGTGRQWAAASCNFCYTINVTTGRDTWTYPGHTYRWDDATWHDYGNGNHYDTPSPTIWF